MKVLVYGASGSQAGPMVEHLLRRGHAPHVLTRNANNAARLEAVGAVPVIGDLADADGLNIATSNVDSVAFLLPTFLDDPADALTFGRNAVDAAVKAGVDMFAWNASGDINESDAKTSILHYLQESALPFVVFEPTTYMENWLGPWTAPSIRDKDEISYPVLADRKMGWIASDDVCALMATALERPGVAGNRYRISGIESPNGTQLAAEFSAALGRDIRYRTMTPEEMGAVLDAEFGPGAGDNVAAMYRREQEDPNPAVNFYDMSSVLAALPVRMSTIQEWVKIHKDALV